MNESRRTVPVDLRGARALVTGGAVRLGRASVQALARKGADVVIHHGQSAEAAESLAAEVRALGVDAWTLQSDFRDPAGACRCFEGALELAGPIDILVNNAAIFPASRLERLTGPDLDECIRINAFAPLELSRQFAAQGRAGSIVNYLDTRILDYDREHLAYHISKRMLFDLTRITAVEFAPRIRVNGVAPGLILPPAGESDEYLERLASSNPLERYGRPEEITAAMLFLLESPFITGQVIHVDGGRHMKGRLYG